jgi:DNA-binding response OmpR family regulator
MLLVEQKRILAIDDEQHILDVVEYVLQENCFEVVTANDGEAGLKLFDEKRPDLVVLDLMLPNMPGLDVFREMRKRRPEVPVIMLTSRSDEIDRVLGLELGADDYVTKPFSTRELAARVKAVLRRSDRPSGGSGTSITHGPIKIDTEALSLTYFAQRVQLTRAEFKLMESLVRYPARVFTRDVLINRIYDGEHVVTDRSIDAYIKRLRKKFTEIRAGLDPIETVHGLGYKLSQDLEGMS